MLGSVTCLLDKALLPLEPALPWVLALCGSAGPRGQREEPSLLTCTLPGWGETNHQWPNSLPDVSWNVPWTHGSVLMTFEAFTMFSAVKDATVLKTRSQSGSSKVFKAGCTAPNSFWSLVPLWGGLLHRRVGMRPFCPCSFSSAAILCF